MSVVGFSPAELRPSPAIRISPLQRPRQFPTNFVSPVMKEGPAPSLTTSNASVSPKGTPMHEVSSGPSDLRFDRLQPSDDERHWKHRRDFGRFLAREAVLDEEFWTAAWLRAETHYEERPNVRHVDSYKRKFTEQEFHAIKRRCSSNQPTEKSTCIIAVKREEQNVKRTVLSRVVGTLDVSIRQLLSGEAFPGERVKVPLFCSIYRKDQPIYGYVSNVSVAKYARHQGIASNMLLLAVEAAKSYGVNEVFVHVHKDNMAAQKLYEKIGFQMFEKALSQTLPDQNYLLYFSG